MPQYFKEHGVLTLGAGKLFHPGLPPNYDTPYSWSFGDASDPLNLKMPYVGPGDSGGAPNDPFLTQPGAVSGCVNKSGEAVDGDMTHWCSYNMTRLHEVYPEYGTEPLFDQQIASATIKQLQAAAKSPNPFFIGCGFHRPHLPFAVPSEYHALLPPTEQIKPPKFNRQPEGSSMAAWHPGGFGVPTSTYNVSCPQEQTKAYRKAYYAAVSFMDSNVGRVLDELDTLGLADSTTVIFMGDQ
jgi:iduronate 2-sulfatase